VREKEEHGEEKGRCRRKATERSRISFKMWKMRVKMRRKEEYERGKRGEEKE
jgi:hypothetical protein